jgi:hypothetical protein
MVFVFGQDHLELSAFRHYENKYQFMCATSQNIHLFDAVDGFLLVLDDILRETETRVDLLPAAEDVLDFDANETFVLILSGKRYSSERLLRIVHIDLALEFTGALMVIPVLVNQIKTLPNQPYRFLSFDGGMKRMRTFRFDAEFTDVKYMENSKLDFTNGEIDDAETGLMSRQRSAHRRGLRVVHCSNTSVSFYNSKELTFVFDEAALERERPVTNVTN